MPLLFNDPIFGGITAPDDATPEEIEAAMGPARQQAVRQRQLTQGLGSLGQAVQSAFAPTPQLFPSVSGTAAMAMGPNWNQFNEGWQAAQKRIQDDQQAKDKNRLQERYMVAQATESEKDRQATLNYQMMRQRNDDREAKLRERQIQLQEQQNNKPDVNVDFNSGAISRVFPDGRVETQVDPGLAARVDTINQQKYQAMMERSMLPYGQGAAPLGSVEYVEMQDGSVVPVMRTGRNSVTPLSPNPNGGYGRMPSVPDQTPKPVEIENPDGTKTKISLKPGATSGPPITAQEDKQDPVNEPTPPLSEIALNLNDSNTRFTDFVKLGRRYKYSDSVLVQYAEENGITDDNSYWPWYHGKNTGINEVPKENPAYQSPGGEPTETYRVPVPAGGGGEGEGEQPPADGAIITMDNGKRYKYLAKTNEWEPMQ